MKIKNKSQQIIDQLFTDVPQLQEQLTPLRRAIEILVEGHARNALLLTCGNGGSASDASHIVGELVKSFRIARPLSPALRERIRICDPVNGATTADKLQMGIRAVSLSSESILLTAMGNDVDFRYSFAQQVCALGRPGDIILALSTSGKSANIVTALQVAKAAGMHTIGMTGRKECPMQSLCDVLFQAPADETYRIQEYHLALYHAICSVVENELFATEF